MKVLINPYVEFFKFATKCSVRILLIDNYDSFTYNLVQLLRESGVPHQLIIIPNDTPPDSLPFPFDKVLISPGPGLPFESGFLMEHIRLLAANYPIMGVCLGHQALAQHFGAKLKQMHQSYHGYQSSCTIIDKHEKLFHGFGSLLQCGRYHSWVIDQTDLPAELIPTVLDEKGEIMAFRHKHKDIIGLQFHPESFMTEGGDRMIQNWLTNSYMNG